MIIGNGDIASALKDKNITYFASGVSNSSETRESEFRRELDLLLEQDISRKIVYFSSLCVFYSDTPYAQHKRMMEEVVKSNFRKYTIMRLGNITWGKNPHTIINFFRNKIKNREDLEIRDTYRYLVDRDEFLHWIDMIPDWNCEMNVTGRRLTIRQIVDEIYETDRRT
jgi:nucleoside-diphosphate-sugar epimerase